MPAIQAFKFSHLSQDPESDAIVYDDYQEMLAAELDRLNGVADVLEQAQAATEEGPMQEDDTTNPTEPDAIQAQAEGQQKQKEGKGSYAICPVCGKRFIKKEANQIYDSLSCSNRGRRAVSRIGV